MGDSNAPESLRAWATSILAVEQNADADRVRAAFYSKLRQSNYLPAEEVQLAFLVLGSQALQKEPGELARRKARQAKSKRLRTDIESFALRYWNLPIGERSARYAALKTAATNDSMAQLRLRQLLPGLQVQDTDTQNVPDRQRRICQSIQTLFILNPLERGRKRQEHLAAMRKAEDDLVPELRSFEQRFPQIAALDPSFVEQLMTKDSVASEYAPVLRAPTKTGDKSAHQLRMGLFIKAFFFAMIGLFWLAVFSRSMKQPELPSAAQPNLEPETHQDSRNGGKKSDSTRFRD